MASLFQKCLDDICSQSMLLVLGQDMNISEYQGIGMLLPVHHCSSYLRTEKCLHQSVKCIAALYVWAMTAVRKNF